MVLDSGETFCACIFFVMPVHNVSKDTLNNPYSASLRAERSNPVFCFEMILWIAVPLRSSQ